MAAVLVYFRSPCGLEGRYYTRLFSRSRLVFPAAVRHISRVPHKPQVSATAPEEFVRKLLQTADLLPHRINIDAESVEQGLAKLVLTLIEFIRRLLEAQALRRMEGTDLTPAQVEELGLALMKLESRMKDLKQ